MISATAVDRLVQLGKQRGGLEIDDIRQALPINTMTIEELVDVLARLEESGISVEVDSSLLTPPHRKMALPEVNSTPEPSHRSERTTTGHPHLLSLASSIQAATQNSSQIGGATGSYVKPATIFVSAAALILFSIALALWYFA